MSTETVVQRLIDIENHERQLMDSVRSPIGSNNVKYNTAFYGHEVSDPTGRLYRWCVVFQWWCFQKAGIPTSIFPMSASVFAVRDWFKERGRYFDTPMKGDLVIFSYSHIGLVEKLLEGDGFQTIEGNKDDRVKRIIHRRGEGDIDGYCRPEYHKVKEEGGLSMADVDDILKRLEQLRVGDRPGGAFDTHDFASLEGLSMKLNDTRDDINWLKAAVKAIAAKTGATLPPG
jgi:hypothetical protein